MAQILRFSGGIRRLVQFRYNYSEGLKKENELCFIATVATGSHNHLIVMELRLFRDNWLLKRKWSTCFTIWYYQHRPKASKVIEKSIILGLFAFILIIKPLHLFAKLHK